jgi:RHH-type transcriptional regulator, proline utilization regulon repressor / proline dehydrogenase / delta 1-pyrroline-5-carboxylate dehydrogenase
LAWAPPQWASNSTRPLASESKAPRQRIDRTPHWLIKQAIFNYLERLEGSDIPDRVPALCRCTASDDADDIMPQAGRVPTSHSWSSPKASCRNPCCARPSPRRTVARNPKWCPCCWSRRACRPRWPKPHTTLAASIAEKLRNQKSAGGRAGIVQGLLQEFSLSSQEGVALMCLAEALLRIPDKGTRDALIRDKISTGNWHPHLGNSPSLFVNAATWGLLLTGKLVSTHNEAGLTSSLSRIIGKSGEPMIRKGVDMAMRLMGEQFVTGETIAEALANATRFEAKGFRYSYDMLGEAALTEHDAQKYLASYEQAIHSIGKASHGRGIYEGPGISIKLSALHPRYSRAQYERVMDELYPRLLSLTLLAKKYDIGLNIDAEEADRLEISLDLLERLCFEPQLAGWNGIGFVIQAYQKRCPLCDRCYVIDHGTTQPSSPDDPSGERRVLGQRNQARPNRRAGRLPGLHPQGLHRRFLPRLRPKNCWRCRSLIYPQFATHNAHTLSAIYHHGGQQLLPGPV